MNPRWLPVLIPLLLCGASSGVRAQAGTGLRECKHAVLGASAPKLASPQAAADHLRRKVNFRIPWIHRYVGSLFTTPFKSMRIFGWTDYCVAACGAGSVVHADPSADGFYTVDLALDSFAVDGQDTELAKPRFLRAETRGAAKKQAARVLRRGGSARLCGELKWDHDGFLEIHPRRAGQVEALAGPQPPAAANNFGRPANPLPER